MTRKPGTPAGPATFVVLFVVTLFPAAQESRQLPLQQTPATQHLVAAPVTQKGPLFLSPVTYSSAGEDNAAVAVGDLNGDGKLDIVAGNLCVPNCGQGQPGGVEVLFGNGDGTFQPAQTYSLGGTAQSVVLADLNRDGKLDLVVAQSTISGCFTEGAVAVLIGNGDGTFQPEQTFKSGGLCAVQLAVADVNGDDTPDVVVLNRCGSNQSICGLQDHGVLGVLQGIGDGSFKSVQTYDSGGVNPRSIAVADVNRDGKPDVLVANAGSMIASTVIDNASVFLGNGDGTFQTARIFQTNANGVGSLSVADLNGDGKLDVAETTCFYSACLGGTGGLMVQLGNGDGTFQAAQVYNSRGYLPNNVLLADINLDGNLDAVVINFGECQNCPNGGFSVLLGNGDGTFSQPALQYSSGGSLATFAALGDVNGDGRPDLLVSNWFTLCGPSCDSPPGEVGVLLNAAKFSTTVSFVSSLNPSIYGQSVTFVATVTRSGSFQPTGTVTFKWGTVHSIGSAPLQSDGTATFTTTNLNADSYPLTAVYSGDTDNLGSTSSVLNQVVQQATSTATLTSSPNPSTVGQAVKFTAKITSPTVTAKGPVTFTAGNTTLGTVQLNSGKATLTTSSLSVGSTKVTVTYNGDSNIQASSASVTQVVQ